MVVKNRQLLVTLMLSLSTLSANLVPETVEHKKAPQNPQEQQEAFIASLNACGVEARLHPLSYEQVCSVCPDMQESFFTRLFNSRKTRFNNRYKAFELIIRNKSSDTFIFTPQQHNLPFVTHNRVKSSLQQTTLVERLLGAVSFFALYCPIMIGILSLQPNPLLFLFSIPVCSIASLLISEYLCNHTVFGEQISSGPVFIGAFMAAVGVFLLLGTCIFPLIAISHKDPILRLLGLFAVILTIELSRASGNYVMRTHKERNLLEPINPSSSLYMQPESSIDRIMFINLGENDDTNTEAIYA